MTIRPGTIADIPGILALQELNLVTNLSPEQKLQGFVTTPFVSGQLAALIERQGICVIDNGLAIAGYAVAAGWDYFRGRPMFDLMIERFQRLTFHGLAISSGNSFQYGPVCLDLGLRGTDLFPRLFAASKSAMASRFPVGTTFINRLNQRSFQAHTRKAGLEVIDEFRFNGNDFYGLAFLTETSQFPAGISVWEPLCVNQGNSFRSPSKTRTFFTLNWKITDDLQYAKEWIVSPSRK